MKKQLKNMKRDKDYIIRDLITALSVCHNVTPIEEENGEKTFTIGNKLKKTIEKHEKPIVSRNQ